MKATLVTVAFVLVAASASAQAPFPGAVRVGDGWVPCDHPIAVAASQGCTAPAPTVPTDTACPDRTTWNPYTAPDAEILACFPRPLLPFEAADGTRYGYVVGEIYGPLLYATGERIIVLSVVPDVNSTRRVVSFKFLRGPQTGELGIFYEDQKRFVPVRAGER